MVQELPPTVLLTFQHMFHNKYLDFLHVWEFKKKSYSPEEMAGLGQKNILVNLKKSKYLVYTYFEHNFTIFPVIMQNIYN